MLLRSPTGRWQVVLGSTHASRSDGKRGRNWGAVVNAVIDAFDGYVVEVWVGIVNGKPEVRATVLVPMDLDRAALEAKRVDAIAAVEALSSG